MRCKLLTLILISFSYVQAQNLSFLQFGSDSSLDIATWNIERFPKRGQTTVDSVAQIMKAAEIDVWGLQEINDLNELRNVVNQISDYSIATGTGAQRGLAYVYNQKQVDVLKVYRIYESSQYSSPFPRRPLVMELKYKNDTFLLINNHYKCCGDGSLNKSDPGDEETRRLNANRLLKQWVDSLHPNDNVIILGDLNDILKDAVRNNVFQDFFDDLTHYRVADLMVENGPSRNWSYPSWPSHLDHIIVTNEVSNKLNQNNSEIACLQPDTFLVRKWSDYDYMISDHRPVAIKLHYKEEVKDTTKDTVSVERIHAPGFSIYPNPVSDELFIELDNELINGELEIINSSGKLVDRVIVKNQQFSYSTKELKNGVYFLRVKSNGLEILYQKILVNH
ncbi:MAG: hypothetical protein CL840_01470 [Crocinitomicaceae bacterium]|nr:hypothetical protein [Crocinitomicaceae bacterium]|tara:strand:- start:1234 stop:2409 length:1176 start_codon:yes stop_codon:yes gene_type:complete